MIILKKIVEDKLFNGFIISLIIINGITMGLETSKAIVDLFGNYIYIFDKIVIAIFTIEAVLKILTYKFNYFKNGWNLFDFSIVVISLLPTIGPFQVLRIFRVFRLFRIISVVPQMRKIVSALFSVIPGMISISFLLLIIFYIFAIITTQNYGEEFPQWFGTLGKSFYTLFQIMTLESWSMGIARPVMEIFPKSWIVFVSFVLIATFVMVNLVIAIVVEAMNKISNEEEDHITGSIKESRSATQQDIKKLEDKIDNLHKILENKNNH